jgi:NADH:ubiquinone oxidoreductase subunit 6 (subunit J)
MIIELVFLAAAILMLFSIELKDPSYSFLSFGLSQSIVGVGFILLGSFYIGVFQILLFLGVTAVMLFIEKAVVLDEV